MKNNSFANKYNESLKLLNEVNKVNPISLRQIDFQHIDNKNSPLNGMIYSLKDNIATKSIITTGGSKFLENYCPPYDSTVKTLLDESGAICISKDNLDEFGLGGTGTYSGFGIVRNPFDEKRISGGSSSGSCVMVAKNIVDFAIGTDTGDSIRRPASLQGVIGFKPTYGLISRYGVYPYSPSLDHVGILSNKINVILDVMSILAKKDSKDMTSINNEIDFSKEIEFSNVKFALIKEAVEHMNDGERIIFNEYIQKLKEKGFCIEEISFSKKLLELIDPIYKTISYGEATTCWANLSGILFGENNDGKNFEEILKNNRSLNFGRQLKRRFVIGAFATCSENYFEIFQESKKVRTLIIEEFKNILNSFDFVLSPGASGIAPLIEDEINHKQTTTLTDDTLQITNFGGFPSITIPAIEYNNLFVGLNISSNLFKDLEVIKIAQKIMEAK
ncbi:MAG: amidase family protein [Mycoplasma sp.]